MTVGDLVVDEAADPEDSEVGIVILINNEVEIPPVVSVFWASGLISTSSSDDLRIISKEI